MSRYDSTHVAPVRRRVASSESDEHAAVGWFCAGREAASRGDLRAARAAYREAAERGDVDARIACAGCEREFGMLPDAVRSLTRALHALEDDPDRSAELYVEIGDIFAQLENYDEAAYYYRRAERLRPDDAAIQRRRRSAAALARHVI